MKLAPGEVLRSHQRAMHERQFESVVPEAVDIDIDPEAILSILGRSLSHAFTHKRRQGGSLVTGPRNHLAHSYFTFIGGEVGVFVAGEKNGAEKDMADETAALISPIDQHFRELIGLPAEVATSPQVNLLGGIFRGRRSTETNRHLDFRGKLAVVQYKMCYLGDYTSVYSPGGYRLPNRGQEVLRLAFSNGGDPSAPRSINPRDQESQAMPAGVLCIEPWNAVHSGPTDPAARGTLRGVLGVTYDLSKIPADYLMGTALLDA